MPKFAVNFGIPWGINLPCFRAVNTCPLDTTLMTWYFISRHGDAVLPDELLDSFAGRTLQKVMQLIHQEAYDKARWLWCRDVLELPSMNSSDDSYNMFGSTAGVFHDKLPELFRLTKMETTTCSSSYCPRVEKTKRRLHYMFDTGSSQQIDQKTVDEALLRSDPTYSDPCHYEMPEFVKTELSPDYWRTCTRFDEHGTPLNWISCRGVRIYTSVEITRLPNVLIISNMNSQANLDCKLPVSSLQISGQEYLLVALIYKSQVHFRSISILHGKYLYYDGMPKTRVRWIYRSEIAKTMKGYFITEA
ncbi:hypothetical protein BGW39_002718, partial [Mortierella sp. 14UC]